MLKKFKYSDCYTADADITFSLMDTLQSLKEIPDEAFSLVVSSPPYNIGKIYEKRQEFDDYLNWQESILEQCVRTLK